MCFINYDDKAYIYKIDRLVNSKQGIRIAEIYIPAKSNFELDYLPIIFHDDESLSVERVSL